MGEYERPAVTVDVVMVTYAQGELRILLVQRRQPPFAGNWALPGGFIQPHESPEEAAARELQEETGQIANRLEQLHTFGTPGRDPRGWVISIVFLAAIGTDAIAPVAPNDEVSATAWFAQTELPELAFDHAQIIACAGERLHQRAADLAWLCQLLPPAFTLSELQRVYEAVAGERVDKRNFRRKVAGQGLLETTAASRYGDHRPARLYRLKANLSD